ncbi:ABC transporter permease [Polynucleobacter meluiroseus]|uniref:ABC transporter permease n=1 Tax=Polynucleobacter meluiroseus TaxID=1938814 RepID=UPI001FAFB498|nr:FtsX-like permease family protein [Polynucleobacter meluiroseus]
MIWLFVALTLSVTALASVNFLTDRLQRAFQFDARQLLAADLLLVSDQVLPPRFLAEAQKRQLQIAQTVVFPSMATVGSHSKLSSLKAVSSNYPLRGKLSVDAMSGAGAQLSSRGPSKGAVWVEPSLLDSLHAHVGDRISLGTQVFLINGVLIRELDRGAGFMNFAPRVMMSDEDLASTGLIGFGSRVTYRLLLAGPDEAIQDYAQWAKQVIESEGLRGLRIETLENAQPLMRKTLERADHFLSLVALLTAMVAAVAIALSARRYVLKQADVCAVMKCFGASQQAILRRQINTLACLGVVAALSGVALGYVAQEILIRLLGNLIIASLPSASLWPIVWSTLFSWCLLVGFAGPALMSLVTVSPIRLVRKEFDGVSIKAIWVAVFGIATCAVLILIAARDWRLAAWVGLVFGAAVLLFSGLAWLALRLLSRLHVQHFAVRFALILQARRASFVIIQVTALGIAIMAFLLIFLLRQDLLMTWQGSIPANAPNRFMINVQADQKQGITQTLLAAAIENPSFYPMIRGRLIAVNQRNITPQDYADDNAQRLIDREFNLSYAQQLPPGNRITAGHWLEGGKPQISLETGVAKTLKLQLGDVMTFEVAGEKISAPVTSLRKLDWGSMRVNFFVIMPPAQLQTLPQSWITAYYQAPQQATLDFELTQAYPNLTVVDVAASLQQIQEVLNHLASALGLLFAFTIVAATLVLVTSISATQDERFRNAALLKAIGASRKTLSQIANAELVMIGLMAGSLAGLAAGGAAWALGRYVLEIEFMAFFKALFLGVVLGVVACLLAGYYFQRKIQNATAVTCLREI